jgi:hypothetical protein
MFLKIIMKNILYLLFKLVFLIFDIIIRDFNNDL